MAQKQPLILMICDGWGIAPPGPGNAIAQAKTPHFDEAADFYYKATLATSGPAVGLPMGVIGNSEVGHKNIGCGFILPQSMDIIDREIASGVATNNPTLTEAFSQAIKNNSAIHLVGLISTGGAHAHLNHLFFLLRAARLHLYIPRPIFIHAFTDGRDMPPKSALSVVAAINDKIAELNIDAKIASLAGRYFGMDRNNNWERIKKSYDTIVFGQGEKATDAKEAIEKNYQQNITDEFILPTVITNPDRSPIAKIQDNDVVICFNFRPDRMVELVSCFVDPAFKEFEIKKFNNLFFATFTEYDIKLSTKIIFREAGPSYPLARILAEAGRRQLHIAETEKYAHVTYFFNGGRVEPYPGEDRILIPSPHVATFDLLPEMSAYEVTDKIIEMLQKDIYDFIVVNFANLDMVGHTGKVEPTIKAVEAVDACIGRIMSQILALNGAAIITADHGNAEEVINKVTGDPDTEHNASPVPFILVANQLKQQTKSDKTLLELAKSPAGTLADIMPTILDIMKLSAPATDEQWMMKGVSMIGRLK